MRIKNFFYTVLLSLVNILFPLLSFPYASRILGPAGIGKVQLAVSFAQYFALFAALGIPIYGIGETARHRDDPDKLSRVFSELSVIYFIASLICFLFYVGIIFTFPFFETATRLYLYAGVLVLLSFSYTDWFYTGLEQFRAIALRSVLIKLASLILLYAFVKTAGDFTTYLLISVFSILGNQLLGFVMVFRKTTIRFSGLDFRKHFKPILYIFSSSVAASMYTVFDTVLLGFLSTTSAVGFYTAAVKIVRITFPFVTAMGTILMPGITKYFSTGDIAQVKQQLGNSFGFLTLLVIPLCCGIALLAPEFILLFSGREFAPATTCMQVLSLLPLLVGLGHFYHLQVLVPAGRNREVFLSMLAGMVTCIALFLILVPHMAETGASIGTVATELVVTGCYMFFVRKHFTFHLNWSLCLQSIVCAAPFLPVIWLVRNAGLPLPLMLVISVTVCAGVYTCGQLFIFKNRILINFIRSIPGLLRLGKNQ
jgi:O-antigen/teichoic acid export membrane protein